MESALNLPPRILPVLEATLKRPLVAKGTPLEIWRAENHRTWVDSFFELGTTLYSSGALDDDLPPGYALVAILFDWEAQCQFSGWSAIGNRESSLPHIIAAYKTVGLCREGEALELAFAAWRVDESDTDAISDAYGSRRHEYSIDLDRLEYLVCYFVDNADTMFYENVTHSSA